MMTLAAQVKYAATDALKHLYPDAVIEPGMVTINQTKPEFNGDYTIVLFPFFEVATAEARRNRHPTWGLSSFPYSVVLCI